MPSPALDQAVAEMLLNGLGGVSSFTATVTPLKLRLMVTAPTATVTGTELSGTGYTAGGSTITFASATGTSTGGQMLNSNSISWTNSGAVAWSLVGLEIWDSSGTPRRLAFGLWDDQPITVGPGTSFPVAVNAVAWTFP